MASWKPITDPAKVAFLKDKVFLLWGVKPYDTSPCPLPVSMCHKDLTVLQREPYVVAPKHDGVRYLLLLTQYPQGVNIAVFVSRNWQFYPLMVCAKSDYYKSGSLFDGELIREPIPHDQATVPWRYRYYVFDAVFVCGTSYVSTWYTARQELMAKLFFTDPLADLESLYAPDQWREVTVPALARANMVVPCSNAQYLGFMCKQWWPKNNVATVLANIKESVSDGLVFMPVKCGIRTRKHTLMFKWKTEHTIDLLVTSDGQLAYYDSKKKGNTTGELTCGMQAYVFECVSGGVKGSVCEFKIVDVGPDGKVHLTFVTTRPDKGNANTSNVILATIQNFVNPVTVVDLEKACKQ